MMDFITPVLIGFAIGQIIRIPYGRIVIYENGAWVWRIEPRK